MHSHLWLVAAGSVALLSACSSTPASDASDNSELGSTAHELDAPRIDGVSPADPAREARGLPGNRGAQRLATGQFVAPAALPGAVQQFLNPGLPAYPDFVAGEA